MYDQAVRNRKYEIQDGGSWTRNTLISTCIQDSNVISTAIPTFEDGGSNSENSYTRGLDWKSLFQNGSLKPEIYTSLCVSQRLDNIVTSFQRLYPRFLRHLTPKHRNSHWMFVAMFCISWYRSSSSSEATILDLPLPVSSNSVLHHCH